MACCNDFRRTQRMNSAIASAGDGLPAIEPGMPIPAGTGLTRRSVLISGAGMFLTVYGADKLGIDAFNAGVADAFTGPANAVIVTIFLEGGCDGMSVLAPVSDPNYATLRPTIGLTVDTTLEVTGYDKIRWHSGAQPLKDLHDAGKVTIFPAISYDHPNQSHFTSRHFYEVGALDEAGSTGWLGRWLDHVGEVNNPIQGLSLGGQLSPMLASSTVAVSAASSPTGYNFPSPDVGMTEVTDAMIKGGFDHLGDPASPDLIMAQARQAQRNAAGLRSQLGSTLGAVPAGVTYPANNGLGNNLRSLAQMLTATPDPLPIRACTVRANGGFDTHSGQMGSLPNDIATNSAAIAAFQSHLEQAGIADRVITYVWSEFGRRPEENDSAGTDHGAAGVGFVVGSKAAGGVVGEFPDLTTGTGGGIDQYGNVRATVDFRGVYCSLLEDWLNFDAAQVIPGAATLPRYPVVQTA